MDFKGFYDEIIFDVDRSILKSYTGKQGDTKSRGLYVTVTQKNAAIEDLTGLSMRFFYEKPDKTRGFIDGVVDGNKFRIDYTNQMYAVPGVVKAELRLMGVDDEIITAKTFKILVDSSIADGSIVSENERGILDRAFELAEDIIPRLELLDVELLEDVQDEMLGARHSGTKDETYDSLGQRLDASEQDLLNHKAEYTSNRQQDQLKIAKVEKELNDYKATMQQINIHQSPTQKASGHGIISLPPNAAEGQISVKTFGETRTNLLTQNQSMLNEDITGWQGNFTTISRTTSHFLFGDASLLCIPISTGPSRGFYTSSTYRPSVTSGKEYTLSAFLKKVTGDVIDIILRISWRDSDGAEISSTVSPSFTLTTSWNRLSMTRVAPVGAVKASLQLWTSNEVTPNEQWVVDGIMLEQSGELKSFISGGDPKSTLCAFRIRTKDDADNVISEAYVIAKDPETNEILQLRSLPNGTKDEINVTDRKLIKRIGEKSNIANGMVIDFADMAEGGTYYAWNEDGEIETGIKGDTLGIDATTLIYQLTQEQVIPVQVSGTLVGFPSGTVYWEQIVPDAGVYTDKMEVLHKDLPIKSIEKLSKVDFYTGVETELDVSKAVIAEDKLSFTHPDLSEGDIVFFEYEYDVESTEGETEVEYYDSRYVIKDSVTDKFYKWRIIVADGVPSIELVEV